MVEVEQKPITFALWLVKTKIGQYIFANNFRIRLVIFIFSLFTHSIYWATAWWSPLPYLIFTLIGLWFGQGIFGPWGTIVSQSMRPNWDSYILKITIPFIVLNYIALFACLYMFGEVADSSGNSISGTWKHFYFSAVTLTTLGYGNLTPVGTYSEIIATIEAIVGFMGFAVLTGIIAAIVLKRAEINEKA
jgi:hypothetical protein